MFLDHIKIHAKAGDGGCGSVSFRRESFVPKGGPDGGDGGRGGSIILRADTHTDNLTPFFYEPIVKAKSGAHGRGKQCFGKSAPDKIVSVPVGTIVYRLPQEPRRIGLEASVAYGTGSTFVDLSKAPEDDPKPDAAESSAPNESAVDRRKKGEPADSTQIGVTSRTGDFEMIADLTAPGQEFVLCKGGKGGRGNVHFKSSRNRAPMQFTEGEEGEEGTFYLELRKIADAGLVGYPNAGKSTILGKISSAHPKIAPYPFTTLTPHVGVVELPGYERLTVADIPGLIEGAHANVGLGHDFLRHILRCKLLVFVVDIAGSEGREPIEDLQKLRRELDLYDPNLSERPWIVVANKMDLPGAEEKLNHFQERFKKIEIIPVAAITANGIDRLKETLGRHISSLAQS